MARPKAKDLPDLSALAEAGAEIAVRVTPGAAQAGVEAAGPDGAIRVRVVEPPEKGRATEAARALLARALGVAPSRLELVRGAASREKTFRIL
jgi:uncharacterized protein